MVIELRKGITLHPCTFHAVIAPGNVMVPAPGSTTDLRRFLFLHGVATTSRLLSSISRSFRNLEVS